MNLAEGLKGRHVLITGASSGLGEAFARLCARSGATVTLAARRKQRLDSLAEELRTGGAKVSVIGLDVADETSVASAFGALNEPLDVLVNNAGTNMSGPAIDAGIDAFDAVMSTNLRGIWLMSVACARLWRDEGRGGSIINVASILSTQLASGLAAYAVSKAGVVKMTEALALEWARYGIRTNAISPGYIGTDINGGFLESVSGQAMLKRIPLRRFGSPDDLSAAFLLLATDASAWMTGTTITVDGGHSLATV